MSWETSWFHNWVWNHEDQSIRGSFINIALTIFYMIIIICGMVWTRVSGNLKEMETFLIGFYLVSFGVWATKKTVEFVKFTNAENIVNSVLSKVGITAGSAAQTKTKIEVGSAEAKPEDKQ
jgi:hypothetical protein